jgi:hypothetical protein
MLISSCQQASASSNCNNCQRFAFTGITIISCTRVFANCKREENPFTLCFMQLCYGSVTTISNEVHAFGIGYLSNCLPTVAKRDI